MEINGKTEVYALIGNPVTHTFSPSIHNAAFSSLGLNAVYLAFNVAGGDLKEVLASFRAIGVKGFNVTIPHKERITSFLDDMDEEASMIGAVNTVLYSNGHLKGFNTDGAGFIEAVRKDFGTEVRGKKYLIIGAGGAAKAVSFALARRGAARLVICDLKEELAQTLAGALSKKTAADALAIQKDGPGFNELLLDSDFIVNATPCGMNKKDSPPIDCRYIRRGQYVYDLIYNPADTPLLREAAKKGAKVSNGSSMLLYQGMLAFRIWTGRNAPAQAMKRALAKALKSV